MPQFKTFEDLLRTLDPADGTKKLEKAIAGAFPQWSWLIKRDNAEWCSRASVINRAGAIIADDADVWFRIQKQASVDGLLDLINQSDLHLNRQEGGYLYAIGVDPESRLDFVQARIHVQSEVTSPLRGLDRWKLRWMPGEHNWHDATRSAPVYRCDRGDVINSLEWLERCKDANVPRRLAELKRFSGSVVRQSYDNGEVRVVPFFERFPELASWGERKSREERWFRDWSVSSAGQYPMGRHWYLETHDYTDEDGPNVGFIPQFVIAPRQHVSAKSLSVNKLMDRLQKFDVAVKVQFGWFFYMVHGNRISADVGHAIAKAVRLGQVDLPINDQAVLMDWDEDPYCF